MKGFGEKASQDWFLDSMTDALITDLTRIGGLRVISQNSAMHYKDSPKSIPEIAEELHVEYVIDASIIKVGEQVRLSAKLVNAPMNENIWAENFQKSFKNILSVQAEFAQAIARQVHVKLTPTERQRFEQVQDVNPEAYAAYLKGRYLSGYLGPESTRKSFVEFRHAIKLAPEFAAAYAGLADAYVFASVGGTLPLKEGLTQAKEAANQALRLDPNSSEAYAALGHAGLILGKDWEAAEKNLQRAIQLNPSNKLALKTYSGFLSAWGRHEEAIATIERAALLDPLSLMINAHRGLRYYFARDHEQAIKIYRTILVTHPNVAVTYYWLACAQTAIKKYDEALKNIEKALEINPQDASFNLRNWLGKLYAHKGEKQKALDLVDEIRAEGGDAILINIALGETDKAFQSLENWLENKAAVPLFKVAPWYDPIRSDPRFKELLKRAGLED